MGKTRLPRGFKAECQRKAIKIREELNLRPYDPLDAFQLAAHLKVKCLPHHEVCNGKAKFNCLDCDNWSAFLLMGEGVLMIIYNSSHSNSRNQSSIMHEIAHFLLEHSAPVIFSELPLFYVDHEPQQELEANTLSSILLLPRSALEFCARKSKSFESITGEYGISSSLARKEINMSGILKQYFRWKPFD